MMSRALELARHAAQIEEVPVGAVIYDDEGAIIGEGYNTGISAHDITAHAEIQALRQACKKKHNYRLPSLHMVVTLEPCPMCASAIFQARLTTLIFATRDNKTGACGGATDLSIIRSLNHQTTVIGGLFADKAMILLHDFFRQRR